MERREEEFFKPSVEARKKRREELALVRYCKVNSNKTRHGLIST